MCTKCYKYILLNVLVLLSGISLGHEIRPAYLEINEINNSTFQVIWKVPAKDSYRLNLGLTLPSDVKIDSEPIKSFSNDFYIEQFRFTTNVSLENKKVYFKNLQSTFIEVLAIVTTQAGGSQVTRVMPSHPYLTIKGNHSFISNAITYVNLGVSHILIGLDHLLFILCLVMIAGFSKKLVYAITGFTVAHSITLVLTTLNLISLNISVVESIIALSIILLASELLKSKQETLTWRYPVVVSSFFGLLHGCGFASVLSEIGIPEQARTSSLLSFNIGVEIGQLIFICLCLVAVKITEKYIHRNLQSLLGIVMIYMIGILSTYWLIDRSYGSIFF